MVGVGDLALLFEALDALGELESGGDGHLAGETTELEENADDGVAEGGRVDGGVGGGCGCGCGVVVVRAVDALGAVGDNGGLLLRHVSFCVLVGKIDNLRFCVWDLQGREKQ